MSPGAIGVAGRVQALLGGYLEPFLPLESGGQGMIQAGKWEYAGQRRTCRQSGEATCS